jgi:hypothetical protein
VRLAEYKSVVDARPPYADQRCWSRLYASAMPSYSLDLDLPGEESRYVPSHEFPNEMGRDDQFEYDGYTWHVIEVATKQFDAPGEPEKTLRCIPA